MDIFTILGKEFFNNFELKLTLTGNLAFALALVIVRVSFRFKMNSHANVGIMIAKRVVSVSRVLVRMDFGYFNAGNHDKIESKI